MAEPVDMAEIAGRVLIDAARYFGAVSPRSPASNWSASARALLAAALRSTAPGGRGDSASTASVPTNEASHQPSSRAGTMLNAPGDAAGST